MQHREPPASFAAKHQEVSREAVRIQAAFRRGLEAVFPHESSGRSLARGLGLDKTLGWRVQRVANATDAATVLAALPGHRGVNLFLASLAARKADPAVLAEIRAAVAAFAGAADRAGVHPREMAAIAAGGLDSRDERKAMARTLKAHHELSVRIRGEFETLRVSAWLVVPSATDATMTSLAVLSLVSGLRTIRPLGPRPVFRPVRTWRGAEEAKPAGRSGGKCPEIPWLVRPASTPDLGPGTVAVELAERGPVVIADPELHASKSLTLGFAETLEDVGPLYQTPTDATGEISLSLLAPTRQAMVDVLFHESIPPVLPSASLYFTAETRQLRELNRFPGEIEGRFVRSTHLPASAGADGERYDRLLAHGAQLVGRRLDEFRCYRVQLMHPPAYTRLTVRWLLPEATARG